MTWARLRTVLTTPHTRWTPEQSYRWVVLPLAGMFLILGVAFLIVFGLFDMRPNHPAPFIESLEANRWAFTGVGAFAILMGIGLVRRSLIAWRAFFAYVVVATAYIAAGRAFDPEPNDPPWIIVALGVVFNALFAWAVHAMAHRAFSELSVTTAPQR